MIALCFSLEEEAEGIFYFIGKKEDIYEGTGKDI